MSKEIVIKSPEHGKEVSILAWTERARTGRAELSNKFLNDNNIIDQCESYCGYCQYYKVQNNGDCEKCPLTIKLEKKSIDCFNGKHPFFIWNDNPSRINATTVLNLIKTS